ncbi:MAG: hypothetical protein ACOYMS_07835 [Terrimicrobiaceae bacterium]
MSTGNITHRLLISATSKGGVGKSFFFINLADWFVELDQPFVFFDSDSCNGTLTRFFPDSRFLNLQSPDEAAREILAAVQESDVVAWDALGPSQQYLPDWLDQSLLKDGEPAGNFRATIVLMIEEDKDAVFQAGETARRLGDRVDWLVVKNLKTCSTTEIYDNSKARQELLRLGAAEITMERVPWSLLATIQRTSRTLSTLVLDESLPFLERQRLRTFQRRFFDQLETARHVLLPARPVETPEPVQPERVSSTPRPRVAPEEV